MASPSNPLLQAAGARPRQYVNAGPIIDVQPATYFTETDGTGRPAMFTICQNLGCNYKIYLARMEDQVNAVIDCPRCKEWTPFKSPPEGFRFVRCSCRQLIRCSSDAPRTVCPRHRCRKEIQLQQDEPEMIRERYQCAYCINVFEITGPRNYVRCDMCGRLSNIGKNHSTKWIAFYAILGLLFSGGGVVAAIMTDEQARKDGFWWIYITWGFLCILSFSFFVRAGWLARIQTSYSLPDIN